MLLLIVACVLADGSCKAALGTCTGEWQTSGQVRQTPGTERGQANRARGRLQEDASGMRRSHLPPGRTGWDGSGRGEESSMMLLPLRLWLHRWLFKAIPGNLRRVRGGRPVRERGWNPWRQLLL